MEYYAQLKDLLTKSLHQFIHTVGNYLPNLLTAVTLLLAGLVLAWIAKWFIQRLGTGLDRMLQAVGITYFHLRLKWPLADILAWIAYWLIVLFFITVTVDSLGLPGLADWMGRMFRYLPTLLVGAGFVVAGIYAGNFIRDRIRSGAAAAGLSQADMLAGWVRVIIILFAIVLALTQIGIDVRLFEHVLVILVAAFVGSMALAFGLGAGPTVSNIISSRYVRRTYQIGQEIRINDIRGRIQELSTTGVMLDTDTGRTFIPAKVFEEQASELLDNKSIDDD